MAFLKLFRKHPKLFKKTCYYFNILFSEFVVPEGVPMLTSPIIWVVSTVLLLLIGGIILLRYYLQKRTHKRLQKIRGNLRKLQAECKAFRNKITSYSPYDPEPYKTREIELEYEFKHTSKMVDNLEHKYVTIKENSSKTSNSFGVLFSILPISWFDIQRDLNQLEVGIVKVKAGLLKLKEEQEAITNLSWQLALRSREVKKKYTSFVNILNKFNDWHIQGNSFEEAMKFEGSIRESLANIPDIYFQADQKRILELSDKEQNANVFEIIQNIEPLAAEKLAQANKWLDDYRRLNSKIAIMQRSFRELIKTTETIPANLDWSSNQHYISGLKIIVENLHATLSRLEWESSQQVEEEVERVTKSILETEQTITHARRQLIAFEKIRDNLIRSIRKSSSAITKLSEVTIFPIQWNISKESLIQINRQTNQLNKKENRYNPEKLTEDLTLIINLEKKGGVLEKKFQEIENTHSKILELLKEHDLANINTWLEEAKQITKNAYEYDPKNWSKHNEISTIAKRIQTIESQIKESGLLFPSNVIQEEDIATSLEKIERIAYALFIEKEHVEHIRKHLIQLQNKETKLKERFEEIQMIINQIEFVIYNNEFLSKIATKTLKTLQKDINELSNWISTRKKGTLEQKNNQAIAFEAEISASIHKWITQTKRETQNTINEISIVISDLEEIASIEDHSIKNAYNMMEKERIKRDTDNIEKDHHDLLDLGYLLKNNSDRVQSLVSAHQALNDIANPIIKSYDQLIAYREEADQLRLQTISYMQAEQNQNRNYLSFNKAQREWQQTEELLLQLTKTPQRVISYIQQTGELSARYQRISNQFQQVMFLYRDEISREEKKHLD